MSALPLPVPSAAPVITVLPKPEKNPDQVSFRIKEWGRPIFLQRRGKNWFLYSRIRGRRLHNTLDTGDVALAKMRAAQQVRDIIAPNGAWKPAAETRACPTMLSEIEPVYLSAALIGSAANNVWALRRVLAVARGIEGDCKLMEINGALASDYQQAVAAAAVGKLPQPHEPWQERKAREDALYSSRSMLNQARSVFAGRHVTLATYRERGLEIPPGVEAFLARKLAGTTKKTKAPDQVTPGQTVDAILAATEELSENEAAYFWLAIGGGLRKGEASQVTWAWLSDHPDGKGFGRVAGGVGKNGDPIVSPLQPRAWAALRAIRDARQAPAEEHVATGSEEETVRSLNAWLRAKGWRGQKVLHGLRAELLCRIYDAVEKAGGNGLAAAVAQARHHGERVFLENYAHQRRGEAPTLVSVL